MLGFFGRYLHELISSKQNLPELVPLKVGLLRKLGVLTNSWWLGKFEPGELHLLVFWEFFDRQEPRA